MSSFTERVIAYFVEHPKEWIPATRFESIGGRQAWRTRISDARQAFKASGEGEIENRTRRVERDGATFTLSEYRFVPAVKPTAHELFNANEWSLR